MNVIEIFDFLKSINLQDSTLFAFTGDIDNLGLFVAANGRAKAECLVDEYNNIIEKEISTFCLNNDIKLFLSMSGEEVFGIGSAPKKFDIKQMEIFLKYQINDCLKLNASFFQQEVTISFGVVDVSSTQKESLLSIQSADALCDNVEQIISQFILEVRAALTLALDKVKFSNLPSQSEQILVFYRNIVYAKMIEYKKETKRILTNMSKLDNLMEISSIFGTEYGVDDKQFNCLINMINKVK